jgi:hypothetical protein
MRTRNTARPATAEVVSDAQHIFNVSDAQHNLKLFLNDEKLLWSNDQLKISKTETGNVPTHNKQG